MPMRLDEYLHRELHPIFQMNLPEGYVLERLRNRLGKVVNVDPILSPQDYTALRGAFFS